MKFVIITKTGHSIIWKCMFSKSFPDLGACRTYPVDKKRSSFLVTKCAIGSTDQIQYRERRFEKLKGPIGHWAIRWIFGLHVQSVKRKSGAKTKQKRQTGTRGWMWGGIRCFWGTCCREMTKISVTVSFERERQRDSWFRKCGPHCSYVKIMCGRKTKTTALCCVMCTWACWVMMVLISVWISTLIFHLWPIKRNYKMTSTMPFWNF